MKRSSAPIAAQPLLQERDMLDSPLEHLQAHVLAFAAGALSVVVVRFLMQHASEEAIRRSKSAVSPPG